MRRTSNSFPSVSAAPGEPAPHRLGRLLGGVPSRRAGQAERPQSPVCLSGCSGLQLPRLSGAYALDVPDVLLKERSTLACHGVRARLA